MKVLSLLLTLVLIAGCNNPAFNIRKSPPSLPETDEVVILPSCLSDWPLGILDTPTNSDQLNIYQDNALESICYPTLATINEYIDIGENPLLTSINMPSLTTVTQGLYIYDNKLLKAVNLTSLVNADIPGEFYINNNPVLKNINLPPDLTATTLDLENNALTQTSIDNILKILDEAGKSNGEVYLFGPNNSIPSTAGLISKANLEAKGWIFPINLTAFKSDITSFYFPQYTSVTRVRIGDAGDGGNLSLLSVDLFPVTTVSESVSITGNPLLTNININPNLDADSYDFSYNALTQSNVDQILSRLDAGGLSNKSLKLWDIYNSEGITNAPPSVAGVSSINNLVAKGWDIGITVSLSNSVETSYFFPAFPSAVPVNYIYMYNNDSLISMDFSGITTLNSADLRYNPAVASIDFSSLQSVSGTLNIQSDSLPSIDLSSLNSIQQLSIRYNPLLTSIELSPGIDCLDIMFDGNALTQASVDDILLKIDSAGQLNGRVDFYGGTTSRPTDGDANVHVVNLRAKGWTVQMNP